MKNVVLVFLAFLFCVSVWQYTQLVELRNEARETRIQAAVAFEESKQLVEQYERILRNEGFCV